MRKAPPTKLLLSRETMRNLQPAQLARVAAGARPMLSELCTGRDCPWTGDDCDTSIINCPSTACH